MSEKKCTKFKKGNTASVGNNGGRPRTTSLAPEEMIALGKELVEWVKNHPETMHLSQWYTLEKDYLYEEWKCFVRMPEFRIYYEKALKLVGLKYLDRDSNIREGASHRWQRLYFADLREEEEATKDADSERKKNEEAISKESFANLMKVSSETIKQE